MDVNGSNVSISTEILRHGVYYLGYEAQYNGKHYISKKEHVESKLSKKLIKQERKLLVYFKHPCIVQQFAVYSARSPVLLMEKIWMSLSEFITNKQSHHTKLGILYDTACGLQYIHERGIIFCDLTANNIFLTEKVTAKLADFGWASFCQDAIKYLPENSDHLPPKVLQLYSKTSYSTKVDIFSFGCVIIHTYTQEHSTPDCDKCVETDEAGKYKYHSEIERRSVCLKKFSNNCNSIKLHTMVLKCLQDNPDYRCTATILYSLLEKQFSPNVFKCGMCTKAYSLATYCVTIVLICFHNSYVVG